MGTVTVSGSAWPKSGTITRGKERRRYDLRGVVWLLVYLFFVLGPLFALLVGPLPPGARFLDGVLGRDRLRRPGDDGPAVWPYRALPVRHRAVGRRRHLPLPPQALADRGRTRPGAPDHPVRRAPGIAGAAQLHPGAVARPLRRAVDLFADRAGGDGPVAGEVEHQLRDVAPLRTSCWRWSPSRRGLRTWWGGASTSPTPGSARCGSA